MRAGVDLFFALEPAGSDEVDSATRDLVRAVADAAGRRVAELMQRGGASGSRWSDEHEKVVVATELQREIQAVNDARRRAGHAQLSDASAGEVFRLAWARTEGLGELDAYWNDERIENVDVNGFDEVWLTMVGGRRVRGAPVEGSDEGVVDLVRRVARRLGLDEQEWDARHPFLDLQLPDGARLFAVFGGARVAGLSARPRVCIRRHRFRLPDIDDLVDLDLLPSTPAHFVGAWVRAGGNLVIAGDWNAGKTTALRGFCSAIPPWHRIVTVEGGLTELGLSADPERHPNVVELYSRPPGPEGDGEVTVAELVRRATRRMNPSRVIVGEVLGDEVIPMLDCMSASGRGSACTLHARDSESALIRLEQYGLMGTPSAPPELVRYMVAQARPLIVHISGEEHADGQMVRRVTSIREVLGIDDGHVVHTELWAFDHHRHELTPRHALSVAMRDVLGRYGWDWHTDGWA